MADTSPSRYWYAEKNGTPVKKYDTAGKTMIKSPDGIDPVACDNAQELDQVTTDTSVLTDSELSLLGY